jgi:enoyl-[acyl-carrier protein] reductase II
VRTRVTELLGIRQPVIQGAMAWIANAHLAAAVSNGGGLGIIACGGADPEWVRGQVEEARRLTDKPFGVNIMLMNPQTPALAQLLADLKVPVITTGAGSPSPYVAQWKDAGCKVLPIVASATLARRMEKLGADAVIAEGCEAGGHIGELTTMALTPSVCDAVSIPVITAGGVADGRGMAAAFALGAEGVQMGTRFLTANECEIADAYKDKVLGAKDSDTIVTGRLGGHPVRQLKNKFSRGIAADEKNPATDPEDLEKRLAGSLRRAVEGDTAMGSLMSGQVACLVHDRKPAAQIIDDLMEEAEAWGANTLEQMADRNALRSWNGAAAKEA